MLITLYGTLAAALSMDKLLHMSLMSVMGVERYQVVPKNFTDVEIRPESLMSKALLKYLGDEVVLSFTNMKEMSLTKRGMFRWILSKIPGSQLRFVLFRVGTL